VIRLLKILPILIAGYLCICCNCKGPADDIDKLIANSDLIFEGNILSVKPDTATHTYAVTFKITRVYKGERLKTVTVRSTSEGDCELLIDKSEGDDKEFIGRHYLLYVNKGTGEYNFDYCKNWVISDSYIDYNYTNRTYKRKKDPETSMWFKDQISVLNEAMRKIRRGPVKAHH